jgi:outer membrane lipoprotein-sorting protein
MTTPWRPSRAARYAAWGTLCCVLAVPAARAQQAQHPATASPATVEPAIASLDQLLARLAQMRGMRARYQEEKRIALLKRPLRSDGEIAFATPNLLARHAVNPEPSTVLLEGDVLRIADASGTRRIDLRESSIVRHFVMTFMYVLSGNRKALDGLYRMQFDALADGHWRLALTPKQADLGRIIARATVLGRGLVVEQMTIDEPTGDATVLHFSDVQLDPHYAASERARLFSLPAR